MKCPTLLLPVACLFVLNVYAQEPTGIRFFSGSWPDVLAEAKRQNKPVFVDFYTTWCPPCRRMAREAFPNETVGAKFNDHFINYQVDAEAGEGFRLAKQYAVASYPTALYLIPSGEIVHRGVGYAGVVAMVKQADMVLSMPQVRRAKRKGIALSHFTIPTLDNRIDTGKTQLIN
ncbi:thioredoxin family protein [Spirosoma areae]